MPAKNYCSPTRKDKPLCDCGNPSSRRHCSAWQCERCISIMLLLEKERAARGAFLRGDQQRTGALQYV